MEIAKLAQIARLDTINGGARALVIAKEKPELAYIVSDVYSLSTGKHSENFEAWECPECGCAHLGKEAAFSCCACVSED